MTRRRLGRTAAALCLLLFVGYLGALATTDHFGASRAIAWLESDSGDIHRFPARPVPAGSTTLHLPEGEPLDLAAVWGEDPEALFADTKTVAFLVVQDGALRYERYLDGHARDSLRTSFSAAKSIVSTLVGIAVADGDITSIDDPITDYLPELLDRDPVFAAITIRDLLTMSSGLRYVERPHPWSDDAQTYYGTDLRGTALSAKVADRPGETFHYNNYNLLLEGLILERATGQPVAELLSERLWGPMGAASDASWSLDSEHSGFEKMESGINATARDYARFGLLFANGGEALGREVVAAEWVAAATSRGPDAGPSPRYAFHWWTGAYADDRLLPDGHFMAVGKYGQFIYVAPERDVVIVRLGDADGGVDWVDRFTRIAART